MIIVSVLLGAGMPIFHVDVANLAGRRRLIVIALVDVSAKPQNRSGCDVICNITVTRSNVTIAPGPIRATLRARVFSNVHIAHLSGRSVANQPSA